MSERTLVLGMPDVSVAIADNLSLLSAGARHRANERIVRPDLRSTADLMEAVFGAAGSANDTILYAWSAYDHVVLQDSWPLIPDMAHNPVGLELAYLDYYERGNFNTRKTIVVSEDTVIPSDFDPKNAFCLRPAGMVRRTSLTTPHEFERLGNQCSRMHGVFAQALRDYIYSQASIIVVDDEEQHMRETLRLLGQVGASPIKGVTVAVVTGSDSHDLTFRPSSSYTELSAHVTEAISLIPPSRFPILITDILFTDPAWTKSGIDVISHARAQFGSAIGIAAWTGFATPFIKTAAYQRGADLVAQKGGKDRHAPGRPQSAWSLLFAVGFLCYQKDILKKLRGLCLDNAGLKPRHAAAELKRLRALLPEHAISMHCRDEWRDTNYLLHALATYEPRGAHAEAARRSIREKYDRPGI